MMNEVVTDTNVIFYLMIAVGVVGVLAKVANQVTLRYLVRAAGNMQKSTHKLIKLVRAKYEHALMLHDRVENAEAFVEKYIYEYRGFLFRIHTWRQLELQSIWFSGILAAFGAVVWYMEGGFREEVYRYIGLGAAEMVLLFVISQLSDEQYKVEAAKNYMVDYLENVCALRRRKARQSEREEINVIHTENASSARGKGKNAFGGNRAASGKGTASGRNTAVERNGINGKEMEEAPELSIRIEGEPRRIVREAGAGSGNSAGYGEDNSRIVPISGDYEGGPGIEKETLRSASGPGYGNAYAEINPDQTDTYRTAQEDIRQENADRYGAMQEGREQEESAGYTLSDEAGLSQRDMDYGMSYGDDTVDMGLELSKEYEEDLDTYGGVTDYENGKESGRKKGENARPVLRRIGKEESEQKQNEESVMKEEAIRQILEEFLA